MNLSAPKRFYLAALFARSNYGHSLDDVPKPILSDRMELSDMVDHVCGPLCESDEHYDMFLEEAERWDASLAAMTLADLEVHPRIAAKFKELNE